MKIKTLAASVLIGTAFIMGCASDKAASGAPGAKAPAIVPREPLKSDAALPAPGKAKVIFFRVEGGQGIDIGVHDGERLVAKLGSKAYGVYECDPGPHLFSGSFGNLEICNATLLPDRIYYVRARLTPQMWTTAFVELTPVHPGAAGKDWPALPRSLARLNKSVVTPEQAERDKKGIDRYMERLKAYQDKPGAVLKTMLPEQGQGASLYAQ